MEREEAKNTEAGEWQKVGGKEKKRKKVIARGAKRFDPPSWTSFYSSNIPEEASTKDLREAFSGYGELMDVYIVARKNKEGTRYGKPNSQAPSTGKTEAKMEWKKCSADGSHKYESGGVSYADVVGIKINNKTIKVDPEVSKVGANWKFSSVIGKVGDLKSLHNAQNRLHAMGFQGQVKYLGGLRLLIKFSDPSGACMFLKSEESWKNWFSELELWRGQTTTYERITWLEISGLPPVLWGCEILDLIGSSFGKIVQGSTANPEDVNLARDWLAIVYEDCQKINEVITLDWNGRKIRCMVREVFDDWVPEISARDPVSPEKEDQVSTGDQEKDDMSLSPFSEKPEEQLPITGGRMREVNMETKNVSTNRDMHNKVTKKSNLKHGEQDKTMDDEAGLQHSGSIPPCFKGHMGQSTSNIKKKRQGGPGRAKPTPIPFSMEEMGLKFQSSSSGEGGNLRFRKQQFTKKFDQLSSVEAIADLSKLQSIGCKAVTVRNPLQVKGKNRMVFLRSWPVKRTPTFQKIWGQNCSKN
ncbi:hypothetical protein SSX86_023840 [Deinandra increscens subsp. villosa]|uniref:RRM domain-containing protein n=1 Tax=Deinandra increscens subsp. villosa TaxID=3103831 RepID=A0AAP0CGL9_9ASTR